MLLPLGISSYTFGWAVGVRGFKPQSPLDEIGLLKKAREFGVAVLQIGDNLPLENFDAARLQNLFNFAQEFSIEIEVGARRFTPSRAVLYADICQQLNASLLRFVIDDAEHHPASADVTAMLREAAPELKKRGVILGIENHDRFPARTLRAMIENAESENIGICLDTANSLGAGEGLGEVVPILAPLTVNLHAKDFTIARHGHLMGFVVNGCAAGKGMMNLPDILQQLEKYNRCQSVTLELWTPPENSLEATIEKEARWAARSVAYLKNLLDKNENSE
jgi:3-oxoisoapionate decarboxylase